MLENKTSTDLKYTSALFSTSSINHQSDYEHQLFVIAQIIQQHIQETKQLLQQNNYKGKELNKLTSQIQKADPYQDKRMMTTIAQWLINNDIQSPNEHTEDIKEFSKLRKQVKDYRFNITNQEIATKQKELLSFSPINKHYSDIQQQNISMKVFLGIHDDSEKVSDAGLPLVGEIIIDDKTSFRMYQVGDYYENPYEYRDIEDEDNELTNPILEHPLLKRMTYCVMSSYYGEYGGPPYYPIFKWKNGIPEQFAMIIPNYIEEDITQAVRNQDNSDRLSGSDIILIAPLIKKVLPLDNFKRSYFVNNLYHLEDKRYPQVSNFEETIDLFSDPQSIITLSDDWIGWDYLSNAENYNQVNELFNYCKNEPRVFDKEGNTFKLIVNNAKYSYRYARDVLEGRFIEGESIISQDAYYSYYYALDVIQGRWPEGEKVIAQDAQYSYHYALNVIKGRFPECEKAIAQNAEYSYYYAKDAIKGRWPEGESAIAKNSKYSYYYAKDAIKGRWPEGESAISQDAFYSYLYALKVIKGRFPEGEYAIAKEDESLAYEYAKDVLKDRFILGEREGLLLDNNNYVNFIKNIGKYDEYVKDYHKNKNKTNNYITPKNTLTAQQRAYFSPYGPGYASPYSDSTSEISSMGPIRNPDSDHSHNEPRGWLYKSIENDLINEWGGDQGQKPNGMTKIKVEKICKQCKGQGCSKCNYKGRIKENVLKPKNSPKVDGRIRDQLRYKTEEEGGPYGSHNRDFNNLREEPQTWDQMMSDKMMLGKPSIY